MNEIMKFLVTWFLLLVWVGFLLGAFVYASFEEERWKRNSFFIGIGTVTVSSSFLVGYLLSKPKRK